MIKQLRRRLTALFTVTTGLILTAVVIGILIVNVREFKIKTLETFQNHLMDISSRLQAGSTISCTWLAGMESDNRLIIHIEDNGHPLLYSGSWEPVTSREVLIRRARNAAAAEHITPSAKPVSASMLRSSVFTIRGDRGDTYLGSVIVLPAGRSSQSLILLSYRDPVSSVLYRHGLIFLFLNTAGIAALMLVSRILVGKALNPIEINQKKQNEFIAAASHELRSPLAVIQASVSALRSAPDRQEQFMKNIDRECSRMSCLVGDLLLLASADAGTWSMRTAPLDVDTLLLNLYERFEPLYQNKGVALVLDLPETSLPKITGDENRLDQVLSILLDNALRYTPGGREVRISASPAHDRNRVSFPLFGAFISKPAPKSLCLTVSDQGCGMDHEAKKHAFDRFYRADGSRSDKQHYGLGLSSARELFQLPGGPSHVEDSASGGACFVIKLPVR